MNKTTQKHIRISGYCIVIAGLLSVFAQCALAEIIPGNRRIQWDPGVRGGIPSRSTICANVKSPPYNALGDGLVDDTSVIQNAINACGTGQVVYLPSGTYKISAPLRVKSGITVRGDGMTKTIIKGASGYTSKWLIGFEDPSFDWDLSKSPARDLSSGYTKGSSVLTTSVAHGWNPGDIILIDQLEDPSGDPPISNDGASGACTWCGRSSGNRPIGQWAKVISVPTTTTAQIDPPLYWYFNGTKSPQAVKITGLTQNAGVEDLTVDNSISGARDTAYIHFAVNSWFLRIELNGSYRRHIDVYGGLWNTITGSILHEGVPATPTVGTNYGPDRAYGVFLGPWPTASLVENTIFNHLSIGISLEGAPSGNVISYNYFRDFYYKDVDWQREAIGHHGAHPIMNLIEGNVIEGLTLGADNYWGTSSHSTFFRNRATNNSAKTCGPWLIDMYTKVRYFNFVGNVWGDTTDTKYELDNVNFSYCNGSASDRAIYKFGYDTGGDSSAVGNDEAVKITTYRHGNWDAVTKSTVWDQNSPDHTLPNSLYLTSKPSWWGTLTWPAIGSDLTPMEGQIPAKLRYSGGNISMILAPSNLRIISP